MFKVSGKFIVTNLMQRIDPEVEAGPVLKDTVVKTPYLSHTRGGDHHPSAEKGLPNAMNTAKINVKTLKFNLWRRI